MELSNNHFKENNNSIIEKYKLIQNKLESKLIITKILRDKFISFEIFKEPNILIKVNDINVSNLETMNKALLKPILRNNQEYFSFFTKIKKSLF